MKAKIPLISSEADRSCRLSWKWMSAVALFSVAFLFSGCASIVSGTSQNVKITSAPDGANVKIEKLLSTTNTLEWEGRTPATVKLWRKGSFLVTVSLPGYQTAEIPVSPGGANGWVWGNIFIGGILGVIIDTSDGAAQNLEPDEIKVELVASASPRAARPADVYAVIRLPDANGKIQVCAVPLQPVEKTN